ncbi:uncharacterized protein LOC131540880 [Onychostoma macrolepis]|uniref:THD domain-containing protein n=1 Tax=Onychostoma macrolepis TaxID=369639 RepID=A0A7J6D275_9TELE|nr:uncharacterized protein LOC131540880 [Onychostoma macrolepis]KAF4113272.1 hypothetical protein G5714_005817 [Onychostoma macrolepis]
MAQAETFEFGVEQGQMLQVLMRHCQTTKRQETRLRVATALLLATFFATLVWLQFHQQNTTEAFPGAHQEALKTTESPIRHSVHLEPLRQMHACSEQQPIEWLDVDGGYDSQNFKLENQTVLHISTEGLYLINLRISYRTAYGHCDPGTDLILVVSVTQEHRNYEREREVINAEESMICRDYWFQSITMNRVIRLEAGTSLRVRINQNSCKFVNWVKNSHLDVTYV